MTTSTELAGVALTPFFFSLLHALNQLHGICMWSHIVHIIVSILSRTLFKTLSISKSYELWVYFKKKRVKKEKRIGEHQSKLPICIYYVYATAPRSYADRQSSTMAATTIAVVVHNRRTYAHNMHWNRKNRSTHTYI